jgi:y4mF family transcriptional regulator
MDPITDNLALMVRQRRKELKIKQKDLADTTQVALRTLRDIEKGLGNPSLQTLIKVMDVLGISLQFVLKK